MTAKIAALLSLLIFPVALATWHKSHNNPEQFRYDVTLYKSLRVYLKDGVCSMRLLCMPTKTASRSEFDAGLGFDAAPGGRALMFTSNKSGSYRITWLAFPLWLPTAALLFTTTIPIVRGPGRQWWRRWHGWCLTCGYDLAGNRSGRCPECGVRFR